MIRILYIEIDQPKATRAPKDDERRGGRQRNPENAHLPRNIYYDKRNDTYRYRFHRALKECSAGNFCTPDDAAEAMKLKREEIKL